ncbi:MAG: hypothetical protein RLZZ416_729 [Candidatus Parcubacteria bacterium]|jgi:membrane-bound lytic murein transglycosylase B
MRSLRAVFFAVVLCASIMPARLFADTTADQRAQLQAQLDAINQEIKSNQTTLTQLQLQRSSYERDVAILDSKIQAAQLAIKARNLTIQGLKADIAAKQKGIGTLDTKVAAGQASLAQILRETRALDDLSIAELALGGSLSDLFQEIDDFQTIQRSLGDAFTEMAAVRSDLSARKKALEDQQQEEQDLLQIQVLQQNALKATQKQKQDLVNTVKGQESRYQQIISGKQQTAAQIQAALFALAGGSRQVSFGDIYTYAKEASAKTGVRPALILGILSEESNLGQNVGTGNWRTDMHPTRDKPAFQQITAELGLDPDSMPVSKKPCYGNPCSGWGGAMGPAQFIPSTWQLYRDRIGNATGQNPPSPWDPRTAAFAAAILLMDNGADARTPAAERLAALRYLAGWKNASKAAYAFYGDDVMDLAAKFQSQIDILGG